MKLKQTIDMPAKKIYDVLLQSAIHDVELYAGEKINPNELKGFSYSKTYPNGISATIEITDQKTNEMYGFLTSTDKRNYHTKYNLLPLEDEKACEVTYTEELISEGKLQQLNDLILSHFLQKTKKKRIRLLLKAIEKEYHQQ